MVKNLNLEVLFEPLVNDSKIFQFGIIFDDEYCAVTRISLSPKIYKKQNLFRVSSGFDMQKNCLASNSGLQEIHKFSFVGKKSLVAIFSIDIVRIGPVEIKTIAAHAAFG